MTDMENEELRGYLGEIPDSLPCGVRYKIPRPCYQLRQRLQHSHEGALFHFDHMMTILKSKVFFIVSAAATVYLMYMKFRATYDGNHDSFRVEFLLGPVAILALVLNQSFTPMEVLWTFSIYLESVAILPQLFMVSKTGEAETITSHYLFALGSYRALYILNWIYRYHFEGTYDVIAIVAGIVQTVLYCDFFYLYITKVMKGKSLVLPA